MLLLLPKPVIGVIVIFYHIFLGIYKMAIVIASLFNEKARLWLKGRKNLLVTLARTIPPDTPVIWMHCASLGEFEQGRPILEQLKQKFPHYKLLLTFFSPSGYEIRKNYPGVDWVFYLPLDTPSNARQFVNIVNPVLAIFVKYEYWYHYLACLHKRKIPTILVSAIFRKNAVFFQWYGALHRRMIGFFNQVFVQNQESVEQLKTILPAFKITRAGDTRFDRVTVIAQNFTPVPAIERFIAGRKTLVAGSTWPEDETNLKTLINQIDNILLIIAPHEITDNHLKFIKSLFNSCLLYSEWLQLNEAGLDETLSQVLIIDNIGMLSRLYHYGTISYIGGGFNKSGIHNTLEAAVYGHPVIFGPNYQKFAEAVMLIKRKGGLSYSTNNELIEKIANLFSNEQLLKNYGENAERFVTENTGATGIILEWISNNIAEALSNGEKALPD